MRIHWTSALVVITPVLAVMMWWFARSVGRDPATMSAASAAGVSRLPAIAKSTRPQPPAQLAGFWSLDARRRLQTATELARDTLLPPEVAAFVAAAVRDRELDPLTRNELASALVVQRTLPTDLVDSFAGMARDPDEDPVWRDYSVQFLATLHDRPGQQARTEVEFDRILAEGSGAVVGTALLHLSRWRAPGSAASEAQITAIDRMLPTLAARFANDQTVLACVLCVAGERGCPDDRGLVRASVADPRPCVRRAALSALGSVGAEDDLALLRAATDDSDPLIVLAARAALERLDGRLSSAR